MSGREAWTIKILKIFTLWSFQERWKEKEIPKMLRIEEVLRYFRRTERCLCVEVCLGNRRMCVLCKILKTNIISRTIGDGKKNHRSVSKSIFLASVICCWVGHLLKWRKSWSVELSTLEWINRSGVDK